MAVARAYTPAELNDFAHKSVVVNTFFTKLIPLDLSPVVPFFRARIKLAMVRAGAKLFTPVFLPSAL